MKFLYFIASHTNPGQVARLVDTVCALSPDGVVYIHHDGDPEPLRAHAGGRANIVVARETVPVEWGGSSRIDMHLESLRFMQRHLDFDWLIMLSGQDYPVRPLRELESHLARNAFDGCFSWMDVRDPRLAFRYEYQYFKLGNSLMRHGRKIQKTAALLNRIAGAQLVRFKPKYRRLGCRPLWTPFKKGFNWYKGSDWFALRAPVVSYLLDFVDRKPPVYRYYRRTLHASESFFHTILLNQDRFEFQNESLHFMEWDAAQHHAHPVVLKQGDYGTILESEKFFARKFDDTVDGQVLDMIDRGLGLR